MRFIPFVLAAASAVGVVADGGYLSSCESPARAHDSRGSLMLNCYKPDHTEEVSEINVLQACLANNNGKLVGQAYGNAYNSCDSCEFVDSGKTYQCKCYNLQKKQVVSKFDLNTVLGNYNGIVECYGIRAQDMGPKKSKRWVA